MSRAYGAATVSLIRWLGLLVVGLVGLVFSFRRLGQPAQAAEQAGWLYQRFGSDGVAYGMIALTACVAVSGALRAWWTWQSVQH